MVSCACRTELTPNFVRLLRDSEAEVRRQHAGWEGNRAEHGSDGLG